MRIVIGLLGLALVIGCAPAGSASPPPSRGPTDGPATAVSATPNPSLAASAPNGALAAGAAATPVIGFRGSNCWQGVCEDVFELPGTQQLPSIVATPGDLAFTLQDEHAFISWSASYASDAQGERRLLGQGGADFDPDTDATLPPLLRQATLPAPPAGDWVVVIQAFFEQGDALYAWHVRVE
jgi:hypothetical protein